MIYHYMKILVVYVRVMEVGGSGGGTRPVTCDLHTLYCECVITRGGNRGAATGASEVSKLLGISYTSYSKQEYSHQILTPYTIF